MTQATVATLPSVETWPQQGAWTYADYLRLPDDNLRYEIIEGVLYVTNAPSYAHQYAVSKILSAIENFSQANRLGVVLTAPFEVHLSETTRPVQPDIVFIAAENAPSPDAAFFEGVPDLLVEVLSPSSRRTDRYIKLAAYEHAGVGEYWIANPTTRSVEVYVRSDNGLYEDIREFTSDDVITSRVLDGINLVPRFLFP